MKECALWPSDASCRHASWRRRRSEYCGAPSGLGGGPGALGGGASTSMKSAGNAARIVRLPTMADGRADQAADKGRGAVMS
eukprot:6713602-Pyramimonas_sp.AAC.1